MHTFFVNFGRSVANLIAILDPDVIVLGGGVSNIDELYTEGVAQVANCVLSDSLETPIVKHAIGDSSGVIGNGNSVRMMAESNPSRVTNAIL